MQPPQSVQKSEVNWENFLATTLANRAARVASGTAKPISHRKHQALTVICDSVQKQEVESIRSAQESIRSAQKQEVESIRSAQKQEVESIRRGEALHSLFVLSEESPPK